MSGRLLFLRLGPALAIALGLPAAANARDWPETAGWTIFEGDDYCAMSLEYEGQGDTKLLVGHNLDGSVTLIVANYAWSAKKDERYKIDFYLGSDAYGGGTSLGTEVGARKGFATRFVPGFWEAFRAAPSLRVMMGETLVDHLNLSGSAAAAVMADRCLAHVRAQRAAEERERKRFEHIPDDPFASAKPEPSPARLPQLATSWVTDADYPSEALRAGAQGTVVIRLDTTPEGRVSACTVVSSSGSALLDETTCRLVQRRARVRPAIGDGGTPIAGTLEHKVRWSIPTQP